MNKQIISLLKKLIELNQQLLVYYIKRMETQSEQGKRIYEIAVSFLGKDVTPRDNTPDAVACMEVVNEIVRLATGKPIGGGASTYLGFAALHDEKRFLKINRYNSFYSPLAGDIIISPAGYSTKGYKNGHVGIVGKHHVLSNFSDTGKLEDYYTIETWEKQFEEIMGFPVFYFRVIS